LAGVARRLAAEIAEAATPLAKARTCWMTREQEEPRKASCQQGEMAKEAALKTEALERLGRNAEAQELLQ
jgi:hypothetical protein